MAILERSTKTLDRADCIHTPCYCEENVYLLVERLAKEELAAADVSDLFVVFVSNERKQIVMWQQRASAQPDGLCVWDYHVFLVQKRSDVEGGSLVWDLDTTLPFPVRFDTYYKEAFRPDVLLAKGFERLFRVVTASSYLRLFSSDRSHMRLPDGTWMAPPPPYAPIIKEGLTNTHAKYMLVSKSEREVQKYEAEDGLLDPKIGPLVFRELSPFGSVCTETAFVCRFV